MWTRLRLLADTARRRARTIGYLLVLVAANLAGAMAPAAAADGGGASTVWRWMDVTDSYGNPAWGYSMSLDYGGLDDVGNALFGGLTALCWFLYQWLVIISIWLINFALSLDWLEPLEAPANEIAMGLQDIIGATGLQSLLLVLTAVVASVFLLRGTIALTIFEVIVALTILTLGTGILDRPVAKVFGEDGSTAQIVEGADDRGWLAQATAGGLEVAGGLQKANESHVGHNVGGVTGFADPDQVRQDISEQLTNTFLRTPHQLINYGVVLDDIGCTKDYNKSLNLGPPPFPPYVTGSFENEDGITVDTDEIPEEGEDGWEQWQRFLNWLGGGKEEYISDWEDRFAEEDGNYQIRQIQTPDPLIDFGIGDDDETEPREIVAECSEAAGKHAENPSAGMAGDAATIGFGALVLLGFAMLLSFTLIYLGVQFLWCAIRAIWDLVQALAPGSARNGLWQTLATALWCLVGVFATSIVLVTFLLIINKVTTAVADESIMKAYLIVDCLLLAFLFVFWRMRRRLRDAADRTAQALSKRPGKKPARMPSRGITPGQAAVGYYGTKTAIKAGAKTTKMGASAAAKGSKVGLVGGAVTAVAGGAGVYKAGKGIGRVGKRIFNRGGKAPSKELVKPTSPQTGGDSHQSPRPHGSSSWQAAHALPAQAGAGEGTRQRHTRTRHRPTSPTRFTPQQASRRAAMAKRLVHAQTSTPTPTGPAPQPPRNPAGPQSGGIRYHRVVRNGQVMHVPEHDDEDDE